MKTKNNKNNEEKSNKKRNIILIIIAIIIIILALLTSCSCTSKFWGRIGDLFRNSKTYIYHGKEGDVCEGSFYCETIRNKNLTFDNDKTNILVTDRDIKLTFSYYGINPQKYTCFTSDPSIATCYVNESGFVVLNPKKEGTVIVTLQTQIGDKIYEATTTVTIGKSNNGIILQQYKGTINLFYGNTKTVIYHLININGKININVGDPSIASATASNGILKITAKKPGNTTITLSVESDGKVYEVTYDLTVINKDTSTVDPSNPSDPTNPDNPDIPSKDSNATLNSLTTNKGTLTPEFNSNYNDYYINLTDTYDITLKATSSSDKASIIYSYNGISNTTGYFDNLKVGPNIITVTVTAEDGTVNIYNVTVNVSKTDIKDDSKLLDLSTNRGELSPNFNSDTYSYTINLTDVYDILLNAKASGGSKITFEYKDIACNTNYIGSCNFTNLTEGSNLITVTVTNSDGSTSTYTVNVIVTKSSEPVNPPANKSKLSSLSTDKGALTPTFDPNTNNYNITLADGINNITINAGTNNPTDKIVFEYNGKKCETGNIGSCNFDNLIDGNNDITVTVIDKDGNSNTYHINVYKPFKYELIFTEETFTCRYEDKSCPITYILKINGEEVDISKYNINFSISNNYNGTYNKNGNDSYLLVPDTSNRNNINNNITVSINTNYNGTMLNDTATVKFTADSYYITPFSDSYDAYSGETRPIAVNTNLFKNDTDESKNIILNNATKDSVESLTLTSIHDGNLNLTIETSDNVESFKLTGNSGLSSLGLLVKIKDNVVGDYATVKITGNAYGEVINTEVKIKIYKKYYVTLDATGIFSDGSAIPTDKKGLFNELTSIQKDIPISNKPGEDTIDLVKYDIPYLVVDPNSSIDKCKVYKFLGYAKSGSSEIIYSYDSDKKTFNKNIAYSDIDADTTFIAVYDKIVTEPKPPQNEYIWAVDLPLFHNEEYYKQYGIDKIIYPGAHGQYTMYIGNATAKDIKLVGMVLEEDTICISEGKCLNMSYYIKAGTPTDTGANYPTLYSGNLENNYQILHEDPTAAKYNYLGDHNGGKAGIDPNYHNTYRKDLNLESNKDNLVIKAGTTEADKTGLAITIHWEWVFSMSDDEDKVDTAIGNYATQTGDNLNDMYSLKVGLKLEIPDDGCSTANP